MESSTFLHRQQSTRVSLRRSPVQDIRQFLVNIHLLDVEEHWETLFFIYNRLLKTKSLKSYYWDSVPDKSLSFPWFLQSLSGQGSLMFAIEHVPVDNNPIFAGIFSLHSFVGLHRAMLGMWVEPKYRGANSHWFGKQVISYCHKTLKLQNVYGMTPWHHAAQFALRIGMVEVAELPNYCLFGERVMDVSVFHSDQQLWRSQVRADLEMMGYQPNTAEQYMRYYVGDEQPPIEG